MKTKRLYAIEIYIRETKQLIGHLRRVDDCRLLVTFERRDIAEYLAEKLNAHDRHYHKVIAIRCID